MSDTTLAERVRGSATKADALVSELNDRKREWILRIPASPNDPDLIISDLSVAARKAADALETADANVRELRKLVGDVWHALNGTAYQRYCKCTTCDALNERLRAIAEARPLSEVPCG